MGMEGTDHIQTIGLVQSAGARARWGVHGAVLKARRGLWDEF